MRLTAVILALIVAGLLPAGYAEKQAEPPEEDVRTSFPVRWELPTTEFPRDEIRLDFRFESLAHALERAEVEPVLEGPFTIKESGPLTWQDVPKGHPQRGSITLAATGSGRGRLSLRFRMTNARTGFAYPFEIIGIRLFAAEDLVIVSHGTQPDPEVRYWERLYEQAKITLEEYNQHRARVGYGPVTPPLQVTWQLPETELPRDPLTLSFQYEGRANLEYLSVEPVVEGPLAVKSVGLEWWDRAKRRPDGGTIRLEATGVGQGRLMLVTLGKRENQPTFRIVTGLYFAVTEDQVLLSEEPLPTP